MVGTSINHCMIGMVMLSSWTPKVTAGQVTTNQNGPRSEMAVSQWLTLDMVHMRKLICIISWLTHK